MNVAIIFAGGSGMRMGAGIPKQFLEIRGKSVLAWTLEIFQTHAEIDAIVLVANNEFSDRTWSIVKDCKIDKVSTVVPGGKSAQDSIYNGLKAAAGIFPPDSVVLLHDGVRPYVSGNVISEVIDSVKRYGTGITFTPCYETIVLSSDGQRIDSIPERSESFTAQAPQGFRLCDILAAHERVRALPERYKGLVDQATLYWKLGLDIHLVPGNRGNIKITTPEDLCTLRALLEWEEHERAF